MHRAHPPAVGGSSSSPDTRALPPVAAHRAAGGVSTGRARRTSVAHRLSRRARRADGPLGAGAPLVGAALEGPGHGRGSTWRPVSACPESPVPGSRATSGIDQIPPDLVVKHKLLILLRLSYNYSDDSTWFKRWGETGNQWCELLSPSETHWATTKSDGMWGLDHGVGHPASFSLSHYSSRWTEGCRRNID